MSSRLLIFGAIAFVVGKSLGNFIMNFGETISTVRHFVDQSFRIPKPPLTEENLPDQDGKVSFLFASSRVDSLFRWKVKLFLFFFGSLEYYHYAQVRMGFIGFESLECLNDVGSIEFVAWWLFSSLGTAYGPNKRLSTRDQLNLFYTMPYSYAVALLLVGSSISLSKIVVTC